MRAFHVRPAVSVATALAATGLAATGLFAAPTAAAAEPSPPHPSPAPVLWPQSGLEAVSATGPDDVWAAGYQGEQKYWWSVPGFGGNWVHILPPKAVVTQWDGTGWRTHDLPGTDGDAIAEEIDAGSPSNVWVTARLRPPGSLPKPDPGPYVARWDGMSWHEVAPPEGCRPRNPEADAAGAWFTCGTTILRWEDGAWTEHDAEAPGGCCISVNDISALPDGSAWAAATWGLLRWDGQGWSEVPELPGNAHWNEVLAVSADEVWAAGTAPTGEGARRERVLYRWDGETWSEGPALPSNEELLRTGDGTMWGVQPGGGDLSRLDGGTWTAVDVPLPGDGDLTDATAVPGAPSLWVVGKTGDVPLVYNNT